MSIRRLLVVLMWLVCATFAFAEPVKYTVILGGNKAGSEVVDTTAPGKLQVSYEYNDRGRGPKLEAAYVLDEKGVPTLIDIKGNDYLKTPVAEHFECKDGKCSWKNAAEQGEKEAATPSYYISFSGVPQEMGLLAAALLRQPDGKLRLLPEGEARIEKVSEKEVTEGDRKRKLTLYAIYGFDLTPTLLWLDDQRNLFAIGSSWSVLIPEGWEAVAGDLIAVQDSFNAGRAARIASSLTKDRAKATAFVHANVFDTEKGITHAGWTVTVSGNRIVKAGPDAEVKPEPGAAIIDASGMTLLPGLWDMHVHLGDSDGPLHLAAGVTSVRDMANDIDLLQKLRKDYDSFAALGPRIFMAGFIDGPGPYQGPSKILADNEKQVRDYVDRYAELGYVQIKIYSSLKPELVPAAIDEAHKKGLRISGHIPAFMTADQAIRMGLDEIQHENFLFLNFFPDVQDTRTPARFTAVADRAADLDLKSEQVQSFVRLLKEHRTVLDPTVNAFEEMFVGRKGVISPGYAAVADRLPPQVRRSLLAGGLPVPEGKDQRYRDSFQKMLDFLKVLYDAGITILAGTDAFPGFAYHRELELYVRAGIPAPEVLKIATLVPARLMKKDADLGTIAPGKLADLILVQGNPAQNISDIRNVKWVMKDGVLLKDSDLCESIGIRP